nr:hypothetical protein GCM10023233_32000 [Brevibacterium otitidis]
MVTLRPQFSTVAGKPSSLPALAASASGVLGAHAASSAIAAAVVRAVAEAVVRRGCIRVLSIGEGECRR